MQNSLLNAVATALGATLSPIQNQEYCYGHLLTHADWQLKVIGKEKYSHNSPFDAEKHTHLTVSINARQLPKSHDYFNVSNAINLSAKKTPEQIAKDITKRLLTDATNYQQRYNVESAKESAFFQHHETFVELLTSQPNIETSIDFEHKISWSTKEAKNLRVTLTPSVNCYNNNAGEPEFYGGWELEIMCPNLTPLAAFFDQHREARPSKLQMLDRGVRVEWGYIKNPELITNLINLTLGQRQLNTPKGRYNHAFDIAFSLDSDHETGEDITPEQFRDALIKRAMACYSDGTLIEALGSPFDTYENEVA